jgi:hypothetical protein
MSKSERVTELEVALVKKPERDELTHSAKDALIENLEN